MAQPIDLRTARARVLECTHAATARERVGLADAVGRHLAADVVTDTDWPTTDRSAMDGFALAVGAAGLDAGGRLPVVGESLAGRPFAGPLQAGQAIRIMTGAVVPRGADTVVPVEQTSGYEGSEVQCRERVQAGANIRRRGSERRAGETVLARGRRIGPAEVGVLAVLGQHQVEVVRRPRVVVVATGDEVVPVEQQPEPHQVRESNSWALQAQVAACGGEAVRLGIAPDDPEALGAMLERALADADVLLTIGGISKGTHDLVHTTLERLGVVTEFHGIRLKPGKPTYFGRRRTAARAQYVFGLPGNPASTYTVFDLLVRPMLRRWCGDDAGAWGLRVPLGATGWKPNWREQAVPARLVGDGPDGAVRAELAKPSPSGDPFSLLDGQCYALVPPEAARDAVDAIELAGGASGIGLP